MPESILVAADKFARLLDYMQRIGLDAESMAGEAGLSVEEVAAMPAQQRLPGRDYSRMYRNAVRQMQTLKRPIPWAAGIGSEAFELMCHSIISSKTLGDALALAQRFDAMVYPMIGYRMAIERDGGLMALRYQVYTGEDGSVFAPEDWDRAEYYPSVAKASGLMIWYGLCGWLIGRSIELESVQVAGEHVTDSYRDGLERAFHCSVSFGAEENQWLAPAEYLDHRLVQTGESLDDFLDNAVYQLIATNNKPSSTTAAIRSLMKRDFSQGVASFERMAENLHMSESSLRRRLLKEDTSYQAIKDQVRCEIAIEHLRNADTKINDLAELLGFTEPSSFVRSFKGWMDMTPKAYRDSQQKTAQG